MAKRKNQETNTETLDQVMDQDQVQTNQEAAEQAAPEKTEKKVRKPRASKQYKLTIGEMPAENQKALGEHAVVITEAVSSLKDEGVDVASRDQIMERAVALGLYDKKPSVQGVVPIFSWWKKSLEHYGWLEATVAQKTEDEPQSEDQAAE